MISLRKPLEHIEQFAKRFQMAVSCYASAIASMELHLVTKDEARDAFRRDRLAELRRRLSGEPDLEAVRQVGQAVDEELKSFHDDLVATEDQTRSDMQGALAILKDLVSDLATHTGQRSDRLQNLTGQLEMVSRLNSITEIRRRMASHVGELKTCVAEMRADSQQAITRLESELSAIKQKLVIVEDLASTDLLTGVNNRREGERLLAKRIRAGDPFCLLLFDLDKFKAVNDQYGHKWGDKVLVTFARRLREQLRTCDTVFRWGGDEFMVIFECGLEDASSRACQMSERAGGTYDVAFGGRALKLEVRASWGAVEYQPGETSEHLFARADAAMYERKKGRSGKREADASAAAASPVSGGGGSHFARPAAATPRMLGASQWRLGTSLP